MFLLMAGSGILVLNQCNRPDSTKKSIAQLMAERDEEHAHCDRLADYDGLHSKEQIYLCHSRADRAYEEAMK